MRESIILDGKRTPEELALILKDWAVNMRKEDGTAFREATVKTMWNLTSKLLQEANMWQEVWTGRHLQRALAP